MKIQASSATTLLLGVLELCGEPVTPAELTSILRLARLTMTDAVVRLLQEQGKKQKLHCPPGERAKALQAVLASPHFRPLAEAIVRHLPSFTFTRVSPARLMRDFRLAVWLDDPNMLSFACGTLEPKQLASALRSLEPVSLQYLRSRHPVVREGLLDVAREHSLGSFEPLGAWEELVLAEWPAGEHLVLCGRLEEAERRPCGELDRAWLELARGDWEASARHFEAALKAGRSRFGSHWTLPGVAPLGYALACLGSGRRAQGARLVRAGSAPYAPLEGLAPLFAEAPRESDLHDLRVELEHSTDIHGLESLPLSLMLAWRVPDLGPLRLDWILSNARAARGAGYRWLGDQLEAVALRLQGQPLGPGTWLVDLLAYQAPWERHLEALRQLSRGEAPGEGKAQSRLVWEVGPGGLAAREQKAKGSGWGPGKAVSTTRLLREPPACVSAQDQRILAHLHKFVDSRTPEFDARAWLELVGHPLVTYQGQPVQVVRDQPRLLLQKQPGGVRVQLQPPLRRAVEVDFSQPGLVRVVEMSNSLRPLYALVGGGLYFPEQAQEELLGVLSEFAGQVSVESQLEHRESAADSTPAVLLSPLGDGLQLQVRVRPAGPQGPALRPGQGAVDSLAQVAGQICRVRRDHAREVEECEALLAACPTLRAAAEWNWDFTVGELEASLACLEELQALGQSVRLEWPQGKAWALKPALQVSSLRVKLRAERDWFALRGEVQLDERQVLDLRELLELLDAQGGRFVRLKDGEFLALTQEMRRRLDEVKRVTERSGQKLLLHPLAGAPLEALSEAGAQVDADREWEEHLRRLQEARELKPAVPAALQAELRPYQEAGYQWLARLAHAGAGACLADDMGLGKTVQTLALLLAQAEHGPSLVVCPTSVSFNWLEEARRFAPSLTFATLGAARGREAQVAALGAGDVLVVSYGLLHSNASVLGSREWQVIVLDEAHYVKNARAKRAQAAGALRGKVRVALTGTPMENHLGELWSLFRFLNPGLLGSEKSFGERFARPIESKDRAAAQTLRSLLAPFTLRRLKSQVLEELPPRTEIVRRVELAPEERALYEAARQRAVERVATAEGGQLFHVLAELTRLRRLCCHPRLVLPASDLPGSKLQSLLELVDELRENRHRALVFSQFVDHLALVREALQARGVSFLYLDGQTPAAERGGLVQQFQAGRGELFLISLKAGGTGLNLTGADYVIHLDPWWNPAVEDQATDRAHRLGQLRPVTVYRLVTRDTIEEQILELHAHKRDLADQLLAGHDGEARLDPQALLALVRGEEPPQAPPLDLRGAALAETVREPFRAGPAPVARPPAAEPPASVEGQALSFLQAEGRLSTGSLMERLNLARPEAKALLERMAASGTLRRIGERGRGVHYVAG